MNPTREVSRPFVESIGSSSLSTIAPESSPVTRRCHQLLPPSTATTANGGYPALANCARPASTPMPITPDAVMSRPCSAITGRNVPYCPGGRAITHSVSMPPRAAETNEPLTDVGSAFANEGDGWSDGGAPAAVASPNRQTGSSAHTPAIPAPSRRTERRVNSAICVSAEGQPAGQRALARIAEHLLGIATSLGNPCTTPHSAGVAAQHDR